MKNLDLAQLDVQELLVDEQTNCNGGAPWLVPFVVGAIAGGILYDVGKWAWKECAHAYLEAAGAGVYEGMPSRAFWH